MSKQILLVEAITADTYSNISAEEKQILITELSDFTKDVKLGLKENKSVIHKMFFSTQKEIFVHWSESYEKLHYLGYYEKPIHTISAHIRAIIGQITFSDDKRIDLTKKEQLFDSMKHSIHDRFHREYDKEKGKESPLDTSVLELTSDHTFMLEAFLMLKHYHRRFADLADDFIIKLQDPLVYKDFADVTEWEEIGIFCHYLNELASEFGILDQIEDEQNLKESATLLQRAMFKILHADGAYRQMAGKFGVSPRQNQRIRQRDVDWPEKDIKAVVMKIIGSQLCPGGCGYNFITQKKYQNTLDPKFYPKYRWSEKKIKMPDSLKNKRTNPIDNARLIWGKKVKLNIEKLEN